MKLQQTQLGTALVETFERRFRDESKIQYRLSQGSLHITRTLAAGTTISPSTSALVPYMVLEWLDGFTLAEQLRARRERGESGRHLAEVMKMMAPVAEAMAFAHSLGVVHRDLNPSNLFVEMLPGGSSRLKVVDFGVAKVVSDHALSLGPRAATLGNIRMFTPAYGAPEQFSDRAGAIGTSTDVYAFALVLLELLTDRTPVDGESVGELMSRALDPLVRPSPWSMGVHVGEAVEQAFLSATQVDPAKRPQDIGAFWAQLEQAVARDEETARRLASRPPPPPGAKLTAKGTMMLTQSPVSRAAPSKGGTLQLAPQDNPAASIRTPAGGTDAQSVAIVQPRRQGTAIDVFGPTISPSQRLAPPPAQPPASFGDDRASAPSMLGGPLSQLPPTQQSFSPAQGLPPGAAYALSPERASHLLDAQAQAPLVQRSAPLPQTTEKRSSAGLWVLLALVVLCALGLGGWAINSFILH